MNGGVIISPEVDSFVRWGAGMAAGYLVKLGGLDPSAATTISGVILGLAMIGWSIYQKRATQTVMVGHVVEAATTGQVPPVVRANATPAQFATIKAAGK